jgi:hypothetical protein
MDSQQFDDAVTAMARRQAERLRALGFVGAAAEVDALLAGPHAAPGSLAEDELLYSAF